MSKDTKRIVYWLLSGCALIFLMVVIGGITRLTHSGLSITEWNLIMGSIPPLSQSDWETVFNQYKQFPEFKYINHQMSLSDFKFIFFWEFIHRLLGRLIGLVFIFPFIWFLWKKKISKPLMRRLLFIFALGGLQGFLGWFMVKSGLQDNPHVSHFRLAIHLITAFITFAFLFYTALKLIYENDENVSDEISADKRATFKWLAIVFFMITNLQIIYGAFVAGLKAGLVYNTFPLMGNEWMPDAVTAITPFSDNLLSNMAGVQFIHRCIAWVLFFFGCFLLFKVFRLKIEGRLKKAIYLLCTVLLIQFTLGVFTLIFAVPVFLGVFHQAMAFVLYSASLFFMFLTMNKPVYQINKLMNANIFNKNS